MRSLAFMILAFSPLIVAPTWAQEACATEMEVGHRMQLTLNNEIGWWFSSEHTKMMLADLIEYREVKIQVKLMEKRITLADRQQDELRFALAASEQAETTLSDILETSERRAREAEEAESGLFAGKPVVWTLSGTLLGVLTTILIFSIAG